MPPKRKHKATAAPSTPRDSKKARSADDEQYFLVPVADFEEYWNPKGDEELAAMHPLIRDEQGAMFHAMPDSELGSWEGFYDEVPDHILSQLVEKLATLKSRTGKKRSAARDTVIDIAGTEESSDSKMMRGGDASVNKTLYNASTNLVRTDINIKKTRQAQEKLITLSWVKSTWSDHTTSMGEKLPVLDRGTIPQAMCHIKDNLQQQFGYSTFMNSYLQVWATYFKRREGEETLAAVNALEVSL